MLHFDEQFAVADGTPITSLTPNVGTWAAHPTNAATAPVTFDGGLRATQGSTVTRYMSGANVPIAAIVEFGITRESGIGVPTITIGQHATEWTNYDIRHVSGTWEFRRYNNNSLSAALTSMADVIGDGESRTGTIQRIVTDYDVEIILTVDGVGTLRYVDTSVSRVTAEGRVGFQIFETASPSDTTGYRIDYITVGNETPIVITTPAPYQVIQRGDNSRADIAITGTYTGSPTAIEARWSGGAWTTIDAAPSGGLFSGTLEQKSSGQGTLDVRFTNETGTTASAAYVGVGEVFVIAGQSNAVGWAAGNNQTYTHATLKACRFGNDYQWDELADPTDDSTGQIDAVSSESGSEGGSYWPHMLTDLVAELDCPVALVPCAKGSSIITEWQPDTNHYLRTTLYGAMAYRVKTRVGAVRAVLWHQGEGDAFNGMTQATYNGYLDTLANAIATDLDCPLVACLLQNSTGLDDEDEQAIRDAVTEADGDNANVYEGPDLSDLGTSDAFHITSTPDLTTAGQRWAASLIALGIFPVVVPASRSLLAPRSFRPATGPLNTSSRHLLKIQSFRPAR